MSLLMDALKKAEEAKRQAGETQSEAPAALALEPVAPPANASPLPELSAHLAAVDADLATVSTTPPRRRPAPPPAPPTAAADSAKREAAERSAARNVFAAKAASAPRSRTSLWLALGLAGGGLIGIGAYFWYQLQATGSNGLTAAPLAARPAPPLSTLPPLPAALATSSGETQSKAARQETDNTASAGTGASPRAEARPPRNAEPESPIRLSTGTLRVPPALAHAWQQLQADELDAARGEYEQVLRSEPKNTDALNGLATIAARQGQAERAEALYLRALEADPRDPTAQAGLIGLKGQTDPALSESRLKGLLAAQPESNPNSAILHFALGNLHAGQHRWSDAQQAYFRAYAAEADNADYAFNLAVSLDHLHQNKLASQYYNAALSAAGSRSTGFDQAQVKRRLLELQP